MNNINILKYDTNGEIVERRIDASSKVQSHLYGWQANAMPDKEDDRWIIIYLPHDKQIRYKANTHKITVSSNEKIIIEYIGNYDLPATQLADTFMIDEIVKYEINVIG